jgi:hypothetical protein
MRMKTTKYLTRRLHTCGKKKRLGSLMFYAKGHSMGTKWIRNAILAGMVATSFALAGTARQVELQGHVSLLKSSLVQSQEQLKKYRWTETTILLLKGEERSRKLYKCRYASDGSVQKIIVEASSDNIEDLTNYVERVVGLVKMYVPPDALKIQALTTEGKASLASLEPGGRIRLRFQNYQIPGDQLSIDVDRTNSHLLSASVTTYLDDPKEVVSLVVQFDPLPDGTPYASKIEVTVQNKNLAIQITNSDYRENAD